MLPSFRKSADSFSVTLASKKRIALRRNILSRRIPARRSRKPCIFRKTLRGCRPLRRAPAPAYISRRAAPQPSPQGLSPPSHAPGASPKRKLRRQMPQFRSRPGLSGAGRRQARENAPHSFPHAAKAAKKDGPRKKRRPSECSAAETANTCRKPTCWASACSDKFHALRTCSPDTCPWSCRARCGRRGSDAPADRRWKDQRTDLRFHPA